MEEQAPELYPGPTAYTDVAPGAPQEGNGAHRKPDPGDGRRPQLSFSEAPLQPCNTKQEVNGIEEAAGRTRPESGG